MGSPDKNSNGYSHPEKIQEMFEECRQMILDWIGLKKLSIIEQVALRHIVRYWAERAGDYSLSTFAPQTEAIASFLAGYYDTNLRDDGEGYALEELRSTIQKRLGYDGLAEYYQKKQDEAHKP
jgi:hypothetical protein